MTSFSTSPVKPHRLSLSPPPKLFSYSQYAVFALSALLVFALFMYIGSDDEMVTRAQNSFRERQLRFAVLQGHPDAPETIFGPMPSDQLLSESNNKELDEDSPASGFPSNVEVTAAPQESDETEVLVQAPESSERVLQAPEPSAVEVTAAPVLSRDVEVASTQALDEIRLAPQYSKLEAEQYVKVLPLPEESEGEVASPNFSSQADQYCDGRRIYIYKLPAEFNVLIGKECEKWKFPFWSMCDDIFNDGFGLQMNLSADPVASQLLQPPSAWYKTDQFSLEVIFHHRLLTYPCYTEDPDQASMFYAPFYHALDLTRYLFNGDLAVRDHLTERFVAWLRNQRAWQLTQGKRHVLVLGRIIWDFFRTPPSTWGSSLLALPEMKNVTKLLIERIVSMDDTVAIPYPTNFHPSSNAELQLWQATVRNANRTQFVSFAGSDRGRNLTEMVRGALFNQCTRSSKCKQLICTQKLCGDNAQTIYKLALESVFCFQPAGDSFTRKGIFDTLLSGCIPVLFGPEQGVKQYLWHLKGNGSNYSVLLNGHAVTYDHYDVIAHLERIPKAEVERLQKNIVQLLPSLLYRNPTLTGEYTSKDAFDVAIDSALERFNLEDTRVVAGTGTTS
ncbi:hypothetical protein M758_8G023300 [Ceratodon purpureus]|nr:hypothetical protein M758_8G023300 [Ceratodon purpureus]